MLGLLVLAALSAAAPDPFAGAAELRAAQVAGTVDAATVVRAELARIAAFDRAGPRLHSVIAVNPRVVAEARALDTAARGGEVMGPLAGVPLLLKDNIESADGLPTTAGSLALAGNVTDRDAPLVRRLRGAGAMLIGKANLSEWANFRASRSVSGWSAVGGLTRNPYVLDRTPCGSSSGSAAAVAAGLAAVAIGTETDGSITCPAAANGLVGLKPTLGLVSRTGVVPISPEQDTPGPIGRSVTDIAIVLGVIAGADPADPATRAADAHRADYVAGLRTDALKGVRIGVLRGQVRKSPGADAVFEQALAVLARAGAVLVPIEGPPPAQVEALAAAESVALRCEFKAAIGAYLAATPPSVQVRDLAQLIAFNAATPAETALFGQDTFEAAQSGPTLGDPACREARELARRLAGPEGLDRMFATGGVAAIVAATNAPAPVLDLVNGSAWFGSPSTMPAVAGYPHLTVPMGAVEGLPVGLSIIGPAWSDARVLGFGYAFEQAARVHQRPQFLPSLSDSPALRRALDGVPAADAKARPAPVG